ncbi:hypothetical protein A2U01_0088345, partial [Trifolium medium]|nr:hypothetical protein [Trifolium medium]
RRATTRRKIRKTGQHCAPRRPQLRVAQTPEENWPLHQRTARRASPSCAPRQRPKLNRPAQQEQRVAPDASARRTRGRR